MTESAAWGISANDRGAYIFIPEMARKKEGWKWKEEEDLVIDYYASRASVGWENIISARKIRVAAGIRCTGKNADH